MDTYTWNTVFTVLVGLLVAAVGSPVTQLIKKLFKVEDRLALVVSGVVASAFALLEMWLSGAVDFSTITVESFPAFFFFTFSVATVYFQLFKRSDGFFGEGFLLKK